VLSDFAPDTPEFYEGDADAAFAHLRANDPVHWYESGQFWCLTRQAEIREVSRSPQVFSSTAGLQMWQIPVALAGEPLHPEAVGDARSILEMDPPDHIRYRRLVTSAFTPRYIGRLEERIREITTSTLDGCDPTNDVDFVEQIAVPLPMLVIAEMIGIPSRDLESFKRWSDSIIEAGGGGMTDAILADMAELFGYFAESIADHRTNPRDDIITTLVDAEMGGERLTEGELLMFLMTLLVAGNETTRNLISGGARALAEHPEQRAKLAADPSGIPNAVEEMLRWVSPVRSFIRCAAEDTELGGVPIREGDYVVMFYGSANRDEEVFGDTADQFDITRPDANRQLAFGFGEHLCIGAALARIEGRVMFDELLVRWPTWELSGDPTALRSCLMNSLDHLPVRLDP
jgi:cytochrome P450